MQKLKLRVLGTSTTLHSAVRKRAEEDLGIEIKFIVADGGSVQRRAVMEPESFDVYDQWFESVELVWPANALRPIDTAKLSYWDDVNELAKTGRFGSESSTSEGCSPQRHLYVTKDGEFVEEPSQFLTMLPLTHNADSFAYVPDNSTEDSSAGRESWAWLIDERWRGKVALQNDAAIGAIDAALAVQSAGLGQFRDLGNLSVPEIDHLVKILIDRRQTGHFRGFWATYAESARLMIDGGVKIQSFWSPAEAALREAKVNFRQANPKEGYRAWFGGIAFSRCLQGALLDAAYQYADWWLHGWPGAYVARQGYYISAPLRARTYLSPGEWDYWYQGAPAPVDLPGPKGKPLIRKGEVRDGGAYRERMSRIAVWNSVMDEHNYLVRRWNEFLAA
jgi:putative spermidine/putrescine transport system substrate-binding protein